MCVQGAKAQHKLTQEVLRDRAAQVNVLALDRLLQHTRRGSLQALWETALAEANARLAHCEDTSAGDSSGSAALQPTPSALTLRASTASQQGVYAAHFLLEGPLTGGSCIAGGEQGAEWRSAARAVDVVTRMVEYIRGSRVDDYAPIFALSMRLCETASTMSEEGEHQCLFRLSLLFRVAWLACHLSRPFTSWDAVYRSLGA